MESGIQNSDYEKSNILLISILKFGIIYRLNVKNRHYRFEYIITVKCFTNITKERIVAIVSRFRAINYSHE